MTDRIDLDDVEPEEPPAERPNHGDWFWRGEGDPDDEAPPTDAAGEAPDAAGKGGLADAAGDPPDGDSAGTSGGAQPASDRVPHVPRETKDRPVGIPKASGGAGAGAGAGGESDEPGGTPDDGDGSDGAGPATGATPEAVDASGPHGGDADDMTLALTYRAVRRLSEPALAFSDATGWSDWLGIVGDVPAHVITKFQREHGVDADFFNGSGMGPRERLADIDERSMFYAKRFVLVGCEGEGALAPDGWEFLPLEEAAEKAGWALE